jgi:glycosyltransferase involved in cell wall biosynthesis
MGRNCKPEDQFIHFAPHRSSIDRTRNEAVKNALIWGADYLYFIDDDMILTPDTFKHLVEADKDVVMADTCVRGYPFDPMHFIDPADPGFENPDHEVNNLHHFHKYRDYVDDKGLVRVDAIGCATVLFKVKLFRDIQPPWFVTTASMTEDVYFCLKAQRHYGRKNFGVYVHTKVPTAHILEPEVIYPAVRQLFIDRCEEDNPQLKEIRLAESNPDRGDKYTERVLESFKEEKEYASPC